MAVPKKKVSYSRTKRRFFAVPGKLISYIQCNDCLNFKKLHFVCLYCNSKDSSIKRFLTYSKTNIVEVSRR